MPGLTSWDPPAFVKLPALCVRTADHQWRRASQALRGRDSLDADPGSVSRAAAFAPPPAPVAPGAVVAPRVSVFVQEKTPAEVLHAIDRRCAAGPTARLLERRAAVAATFRESPP